MIRVKVLKNGVQTHGADVPTQQLVDGWIAKVKPTGAWGKVAGAYPLSRLSESELLTEISRVIVDDLGNPLPEPVVTIPDQFTIEQTDVTAEYVEIDLKRKSILAINIGADIMADIRTLNKKKLLAATMTGVQFEALLQDATAQSIERALWNGSFATAKTLMQGFSGYYTVDEKTVLISRIDDCISKGL